MKFRVRSAFIMLWFKFFSQGLDVNKVDVPVIGGHAGATILPLLSQTTPAITFTDEEIAALTVRIQVCL